MSGGFLSLTAFQAEGCGIALRAMSFIVSHLSSIPEHASLLEMTMSADAIGHAFERSADNRKAL
jgi:hypothetical protein